jgi:copper transport protein
MSKSTIARLLCTLLIALGLALLTTRAAWAHARLVRSDPADGAVLGEAPREIYLWFDEAIAVPLSSARLLSADGQPVGEVQLRAHPGDPQVLIVEAPAVSSGVYSLAWKVLSNVDSHVTQGWPEAILGALNFGLQALLVGAWCAGGLLVRPRGHLAGADGLVRGLQRRAWGLGLMAAVGALLAGAGLLAWRLQGLEGATLGDLLAARFGSLWLARQSLLVITLLALIAARRGLGWGWPSAGAALLALALVQAADSHAAASPTNELLSVAVQAVHLLAAGAWVGTLWALLLTTLPLLRQPGLERDVALATWRRFGAWALLNVGVLAATGLYNAGRQVASLDAWLVTLYGRVLAGKIALFFCAGLAGLTNSALLHPRVAGGLDSLLRPLTGRALFGGLDRRRLPVIVGLEAGLGLLVLAVTGLLTATPPARGPEFAPPGAAEALPSSFTQTADDLIVNWAARPNKVGPNLLTIGVFNTRRPAPADILRVQVRLAFQDQSLGAETFIAEPEGDGRYRINTNALSLAGNWRAEVIVRRKGLPDSRASFDWRVEPLVVSAPPRPGVVSNAPLDGPLSWLALGVLVAGLAAAALAASQTREPSAAE